MHLCFPSSIVHPMCMWLIQTLQKEIFTYEKIRQRQKIIQKITEVLIQITMTKIQNPIYKWANTNCEMDPEFQSLIKKELKPREIWTYIIQSWIIQDCPQTHTGSQGQNDVNAASGGQCDLQKMNSYSLFHSHNTSISLPAFSLSHPTLTHIHAHINMHISSLIDACM